MELPDDAPKLPKIPFIIGDVILLGVATTLLYRLGETPTTAQVVAIIACAGLGVTCFLAPFLITYARKQEQQLIERQGALEALTRTTSAAADQASIAANGLHEIAEVTKRNLHSLEELPAKIEAARQSAKSKENHQHATAVEALRNDFDQLREEQSGSTESTTQLLEKLSEQIGDLESRLSARLGELDSQVAALKVAPVPAPTPAPTPALASAPEPELKPEPEPEPEPEPTPEPEPAAPASTEPDPETAAEPPAEETAAAPEPTPEPEPETKAEAPPKPKKKPRKTAPKAVEPSLFDSMDAAAPPEPTAAEPTEEPEDEEEPSDSAPELEAEPETASSEVTAVADETDTDEVSGEAAPFDDEPPPEPSLSSDGLTRLTVTAYIGIGNRLFIRGDGPGLSREEGTPLQFVSIGKWRWETDAATAPVKVSIWKNDQIECTTLGEIELAPGAQLETSANF